MEGVVPPPVGVSPNFGGARTMVQEQSIVMYTVLIAVSTLFVFLRLYTRLSLTKNLGWDDMLIFLSWIGCIAWTAICLSAIQYGFGEHIWNITQRQFAGYLKLLTCISIAYVWTPALSKLSLLALYHRISTDKWDRVGVCILFTVILGYNLGITITIVGPCNLLEHSDPTCLKDANLAMAILNIITDVCIIVMPIHVLLNLQIDLKHKILIGIIFSVGSGVIVISIVRIIYVYKYVGEIDVTYYQAAAALFSTAELNAGVICTSMVGLQPFIQACWAFVYACWMSIKDFKRKTHLLLTEDELFGLELRRNVSFGEEGSEAGPENCDVAMFSAVDGKEERVLYLE